jgi:hypothetical protein
MMALPTRPGAREVLKLRGFRLYPLFGGSHLPAFWKVFIIRLSNELPNNLGSRGPKLLDELL